MSIPWYIEPEQVNLYKAWDKKLKGGDPSAIDETMQLIKASPAFLLHNYTQIQDKSFRLVPFRNWSPPQKKLYRVVRNLVRLRRPVRIVIVKPRQTGISTLTEGMCYWNTAFHPNRTSLIAAQEDDAATRIFEMFRVYYASTPEAIRPPADKFTTDEIRFGEQKSKQLGLASRIITKTAALGSTRKSEAGKGRGGTYSFVHGSEVAFWPSPKRFIVGIEDGIPDQPNTYFFLESTANGVGNWFHQRWSRASEGWRMKHDDSGSLRWMRTESNNPLWIPFFISWLEQPEYQMPIANGKEERERAYYTKHLDKDERRLVKEFGATLEQIEWRRYQIEKKNGDMELFNQEFPAEPKDAFVFSGNKVFDLGAMQTYDDQTRDEKCERGHLVKDSGKYWISQDPHGPLKIFKRPLEGRSYVIGADPCEGRGRVGDNACAQVLCSSSPNPDEAWEQVAVFNARVDPDEFAQIIYDLGQYYGEAFLIVERLGGGQQVCTMLQKMNYWNRYRRREWDKVSNQFTLKWDWQTNTKSRSMLVAALRGAIRQRQVKINDNDTVQELMGWTRVKGARGTTKEAPADSDGHDDRIIALGLAVQGGILDNPAEDDETQGTSRAIEDEPRKFRYRNNEANRRNGTDFGNHW